MSGGDLKTRVPPRPVRVDKVAMPQLEQQHGKIDDQEHDEREDEIRHDAGLRLPPVGHAGHPRMARSGRTGSPAERVRSTAVATVTVGGGRSAP